MSQPSAWSAKAYQRLKEELLYGSLAGRDRLDLAEQARTFGMSVTPVREAAMRLIGEGLVEPSAVGGVRAVPLTETRVRELLTVNHRLCLLALTWSDVRRPQQISLVADDTTDIERTTRVVFEAIVKGTENAVLIKIIDRINDSLTLVRRVEPLVLPDPVSDLAELAARLADTGRARTHAIGRYHRKRLDRAASLTWAARGSPDA